MTNLDANDHVGGYESLEVRLRPIVVSVAALAIVTLAVLGLMKLAHTRLLREAGKVVSSPHSLAEPSQIPPEPRLQDTPARDLALLRAREEGRLSTYGWVDRQAGVTRIPIERAIELVAREGLPARGARDR